VYTAGCQTGLYNRFDNQLYTRYSQLSNGCQTGCIVYANIYPVVKSV